MSGKQVLFDALRHRHTDQIPWVPFAGVHAGKLVGKDATEVLTNADALFEALLAVGIGQAGRNGENRFCSHAPMVTSALARRLDLDQGALCP